MDVVPDFKGMLRDGMTVAERQDQLRYETDAKGNPIKDARGEFVPRGVFALRKYAADPRGPIRKPARSIMFESVDVLVNLISKEELGQGLIQKNPKVKKPAPPEEETTKMVAPQRTIQVRRTPVATSAKAPEATNGKNGKTAAAATTKTGPATNKKRPGVPSKATEDASETAAPAKAAGPDVSAVLKAVQDLKKELVAFRAEQNEKLTNGLTILHDVLMQRVNNSLIQVANMLTEKEASVPEDENEHSLLAHEDGPLDIFSYLDGNGGSEQEASSDEDEDEGN